MTPMNPVIVLVTLVAMMPGAAEISTYDASQERLKSGVLQMLSPSHRAIPYRQLFMLPANSAQQTVGTYGPKPTSAPAGAIILHAGDNISAIVNAAPTGATFYFEPGVYRGVSLTPKSGQAFIGAEGTILNGAAVLTGFTPQGNLWVIGGQTQQGFRHATDVVDPLHPAMRAGYPETVFVDDKPLKPVDALSMVVPGTFYLDYNADKIYIADNPAGHTIEAGKLAHAFHGNAQNVTVKNLAVEKYNSPVQSGAIQGNQNWTIQDNEVRLNYGVGIVALDKSKIIGNYVHDNGQMGLGGSGDHIRVEANEIANNSFWSGIDPGWEGGGFKFADTNGLIVQNNYSHDNNGSGMWTDWNNINTLYENNVIVHNAKSGIHVEASYNTIIRNNVLIGNGAVDFKEYGWLWADQILIHNSKNVEIYGNKIDMTGANGIGLVEQNRNDDPGRAGPFVTTGNYIHDNIIVSYDNVGRLGGVEDYSKAVLLDDNSDNVWEDNQYVMPDGNRFWWGGVYNFAEFKSVTGEDGTISQIYPSTDDWLTGTAADPNLPSTDNPLPLDAKLPPPQPI
jgi:parallel beta-helix repeat protein